MQPRIERLILVLCAGAACASPQRPSPGPQPRETPSVPKETVVAVDAVESAPPRDDYDVNHVLVTGQSLAIGVGGRPYLTREQPFSNLMFATGVMAGRDDLSSFVPLVEGDFVPGTRATTETMSSAFANLACDEGRHPILVSVHGAGAFPYFKLKKGTRPYETG